MIGSKSKKTYDWIDSMLENQKPIKSKISVFAVFSFFPIYGFLIWSLRFPLDRIDYEP